ncbi:hypothetical protein RQN9TF_18130 [Rhodococcus qingshengii]|uniref:hypothetical protein n=1 Tax=Rhodococcus TaxID=1827 RepID=UPI000F616354|nr:MULTISPECIES: hypothetical protein [Rhodococcus]AZI62791.1 hypothetical protein EHW12_17670 [Rhodococcus sp. NJ-530]BDQ21135.1 hypothetical protein RQN9TF_18130 [Rhodococcus qingshengii]
MPANTDFDDFDDTEPEAVDVPTADEIAAARMILAQAKLVDVDGAAGIAEIPADPLADEAEEASRDNDEEIRRADEAAARAVAHERKPKGNRKQRRSAGKIPDNAPKPQDRQKKTDARRAEANGDAVIKLTLWGEEIEIDRSTLSERWDWQLGMIEKNTLQMVKGLLGEGLFVWFCKRSQGDGKTPYQAANELMQLFSDEVGTGGAGNS